MGERDGVGGSDAFGAGCAILTFLWLGAAVALIAMHVVGVRPGEGILEDLPLMPTDETGFTKLAGEALVIMASLSAGLLPAVLAAFGSVFVLDRLTVSDPAADRIFVGILVAVFVVFVAGIVVLGAWGWLVVAGLGPIAVFFAVAFGIGWVQERREVRAKEDARDLRVRLHPRLRSSAGRAAQTPTPAVVVPSADARLGAEAAAWNARNAVDARLAWEFSRAKCAAWAVAGPVVVVAVTWFVMALGGPSSSTAADPEQRAFEDALLVVVVAAIFGLLALLTAWEFGRLALFGGGFYAAPDGLTLRFGHAVRDFTWDEVGSVAVGKGNSGTVIVIGFREGGIRWPRAMSFSASDTDTLCIFAGLFADPADGVVRGVRAARARFRGPDSAEAPG